jgi:hypothetical protein
VITPDLAAFLEGEVAIHIATRNKRLEPNGARVAAVTVDADGTHVTAYLPKKVLNLPEWKDNLESRQAALVFARPSDDHSCQIKGVFVEARAAAARERKLVDRQWDAFLTNLAQIGIPRQVAEATSCSTAATS